MRVARWTWFAAAVLLASAACGEPERQDRIQPDDGGTVTPRTQGVTPSATTFAPGTVALFDVENGTAESLDLGIAALRAAWLDDGDTLLALDAYTGRYVAIELDGTVVREVADTRLSTGDEPRSVVHVIPVNDGRRVAVFDWEGVTATLVDVFDGTSEVMRDGALVIGAFSPDGEWFFGAARPASQDGSADPPAARIGVFPAAGDCGDDAPFACLEWELPQEADARRGMVEDAWSPDGGHLLVSRQTPCPGTDPRTSVVEPCSPDVTIEVYSWPERQLVASLPAGESGDARWAGAGRVHVRGSGDPAFPGGYIANLDGTRGDVPELFDGCCASYSPDGRHAVVSLVPGEDCSLVEVATGGTVASVPAGAGDTNDTGICQFVSWTRDGSLAIATGVAPP